MSNRIRRKFTAQKIREIQTARKAGLGWTAAKAKYRLSNSTLLRFDRLAGIPPKRKQRKLRVQVKPGAPSIADREKAVELVCAHHFPWCRARLMHALAGAAEQGVLNDVLHELFENVNVDTDYLTNLINGVLKGWTMATKNN